MGAAVTGWANARRKACSIGRRAIGRPVRRAAVDAVAHDRQADVGEVDADLVLPARLESHLEERGRRRGARGRASACGPPACSSPGRATPRRPLT